MTTFASGRLVGSVFHNHSRHFFEVDQTGKSHLIAKSKVDGARIVESNGALQLEVSPFHGLAEQTIAQVADAYLAKDGPAGTIPAEAKPVRLRQAEKALDVWASPSHFPSAVSARSLLAAEDVLQVATRRLQDFFG